MEEHVTDSIRRELEQTTSYDADNMRLLLAEDFMRTKGFVFLEGSDDVKFFRAHLSSVTIGIEYYGTGGKHGIEKALADERIRDDRVIGICDKDYSELQMNRMFYCDKCCLELMVMSDMDIWNRFCVQYYLGNEEPEEFILNILRSLAPISMLRKESALKNEGIEGIDFRGLAYGKYLDQDMYSIQTLQIFIDFGWKEYYEHCKQLADQLSDDELYDYTNGHDMCKILGMICETQKRPMGEKRVRDTLYEMYGRENFIMTKLHDSLKQYQHNRTWKYVD